MGDLKPCPFCGVIACCSKSSSRYDPKGSEARGGLLYQQTFGYGCSTCGVYRIVDGVDNMSHSEATRLKALAAWNARAPKKVGEN